MTHQERLERMDRDLEVLYQRWQAARERHGPRSAPARIALTRLLIRTQYRDQMQATWEAKDRG